MILKHILQKKRFPSFAITLLLFCNALSLHAQLNESNYRVFSVHQNKEVSLQDLVTDMNNYDVLFYGEEHNDSVTHYIESTLLQLLYKQYPQQISLSMEMFERDVQTVMNEYLDDLIREKHFKKDARVWNNYNDYRPMVEFAKENKMDIICANAAGRYSNLVGRKGMQGLIDLPFDSKKNFAPLPFDTATGAYYDKIIALTRHDAPIAKNDSSQMKAPMPNSMGNFNFVYGQSLWDATMAYSIATYLKKNNGMKIMQVNGRVHSDEAFGIVAQLPNYCNGVKSIVVSTFSIDNFDHINWDHFKTLGDYIIITDPKVPKTFD